MAVNLPAKSSIPKSGNMLEPYKYIKGEPVWTETQIDILCLNLIRNNEYNYINEDLRMNIEQATADVEQLTKVFGNKIQQFTKIQADLSEQAKKVSGQVRDSANKLNTAMQTLDKSMNLDKLQQQTELLERMAAAMIALANLEQSGHLDRISKALKNQ